MSLDENLTRALHEEADRIDVDVARLHAATRDRLLAPPRRRRTLLPVLVATVALVVVVLVVALGVGRLGGGIDRGLAPADHRGQVETTFGCPSQITVDRAGTRKDDSFLPDVDAGPREAARQLGAPRFAFTRDGDHATLRLGNADGSLASTAAYTRSGDRWRLDETTKCAAGDGGILVPDANPLRLGARDATPYSAKSLGVDPAEAVLVDDRSTYDASGLEQHHTIWAAPCERQVCLTGGKPGSMVIWTPDAASRPADVDAVLRPPDDSVGRPTALGFWAVYDADGSVKSVRGGGTEAVRLEKPGWPGALYLLLAHKADVRAVTVRTDSGSTTFPVGTIR